MKRPRGISACCRPLSCGRHWRGARPPGSPSAPGGCPCPRSADATPPAHHDKLHRQKRWTHSGALETPASSPFPPPPSLPSLCMSPVKPSTISPIHLASSPKKCSTNRNSCLSNEPHPPPSNSQTRTDWPPTWQVFPASAHYMTGYRGSCKAAHLVVLLRADDLGLRVGQGLPPVRQVACHPGHGKQHRKVLCGKAHGLVHQPCARPRLSDSEMCADVCMARHSLLLDSLTAVYVSVHRHTRPPLLVCMPDASRGHLLNHILWGL